ncbi:MAG: hypothetical protein B7X04_01200 [Parcubacteria group bacterium 21-54-25]|nr:MAG: hypothetical protein B7X04_01200 [Parcubacteria group bacterium 21-54-25]HQU07551.1 hypothetical protein [Candidatus Paceibacterota bacterium]
MNQEQWLVAEAARIERTLTTRAREAGIIADDQRVEVTCRIKNNTTVGPERKLKITHHHVKTGLRFIDVARLSRATQWKILALFGPRDALTSACVDELRVLLERLLIGHKNNPLSVPFVAGRNPHESRITRINALLLETVFEGKRYRLVRNYYPGSRAYEIQLWEIEGKLSPSYSGPSKKRSRKRVVNT